MNYTTRLHEIARRSGATISEVTKQLAIGQLVEMEHRMGRDQATKIALDHIEEDPFYYTNLSISEGIGKLAQFHIAAPTENADYHEVSLRVMGDDPKDVFASSEKWINLVQSKISIYGLWERATVIPGNPSTASNLVVFYVSDIDVGNIRQAMAPSFDIINENVLVQAELFVDGNKNGGLKPLKKEMVGRLIKYNNRRNQKVSMLDITDANGHIVYAFASGGVVATEGVDPKIVHRLELAMKGSKNVMNRDIMPQIKNEYLDEYIDYLTGFGYDVTFHKSKAKDLKASQSDLNASRVARIADKIKSGNARERKYITDKNGYILDGHHSWGGNYVVNPNTELDAITVNAPIDELIRVTKQFPKVEYEMI